MNKAFTLVELLAVIVVLAIVLIVTTPNVLNVINDSKNNLNKTQKEQIINAAMLYGTRYVTKDMAKKTPYPTVTIGDLQNYGYLNDKEITDIINNNNLNSCKIEITWNNNQLKYSFKEGCPSTW